MYLTSSTCGFKIFKNPNPILNFKQILPLSLFLTLDVKYYFPK
jgi:hypothetical protein